MTRHISIDNWEPLAAEDVNVVQLPPFRYQPLQEPGDIRILTIENESDIEAKLSLRLQHVSNDSRCPPNDEYPVTVPSKTNYEAVSYAWEMDDERVPAMVEYCGKIYIWDIRRSVETMLRHLRLRCSWSSGVVARSVWVDALCINQNDDEKAIQVNRMSNIYSEADRVLVWLGTDKANCHAIARVMRWLKQCGTEEQMRDNTYYRTQRVETHLQRRTNIAYVYKLLERRWFHRRWVVQEVTLARDAVLIWGYTIKSSGGVATAVGDEMHYRHFRFGLQASLKNEEVPSNVADILLRLPLIAHFRRNRSLEMLYLCHQAQCMDDRDRLYALNSLSSSPFEVDYTCDADEVYKRFAAREVRSQLELLNYAAAFRPESVSGMTPLPSWIPDWRSSPICRPLSLHKYRLPPRCTPVHVPRILGNSTILLVYGTVVGMIRDIDRSANVPWQSGKTIAQWYDYYLHNKSRFQPTDQVGDSLDINFISTITTDYGAFEIRETMRSSSIAPDVEYLLDEIFTMLWRQQLAEESPRLLSSSAGAKSASRIGSLWIKWLATFNLTYLVKCLAIVNMVTRSAEVDRLIISLSRGLHQEFNFQEQPLRPLPSTREEACSVLESIITPKSGAPTLKSLGFGNLRNALNSLHVTVNEIIAGRTCFTTHSGDFGICHESARPGDLIVLLQGAETPLIMRPWTKDELANAVRRGVSFEEEPVSEQANIAGDQGYFRLVGDCYIQHYMEKLKSDDFP